MRSCFILIACVVAFLTQMPAHAGNLEQFKADCSEMGFSAGTERFGSCVLELRRRASKTQESQSQQAALDAVLAESRRQHQEQLRAYREAEADARRRRAGAALMQFGLGMAQTGQIPTYNPSGGGFTRPPRTDLSCVNKCVGLGFLLDFCKSKCSF